MIPKIKSNFLYMTCNFGSEKAVVHEMKSLAPDLTMAFSKKGFITFKSPLPIGPSERFDSVFARAQGLSLAQFKVEDENLSEIMSYIDSLLKQYPTSLVHVFPRDRVDKEGDDSGLLKLAEKYQVIFKREVKLPEMIIDLILVEEKEIWVGLHQVKKEDLIIAGNRPQIDLPETAPSRAYLKMAEAFLYFGPKIAPGDCIMEIGSSPGGASYFLLSQGYKVLGVDNAQMDPIVTVNRDFHHIKKVAGQVEASDLKDKVKWLAMDINVKPEIAFMELKKLLPILKDLKGALLTFKIPRVDGYLEVQDYLKRVSKLGFKHTKARQLFYNKQEVFIFATKE